MKSRVEHSRREIIERKFLAVLSDDDTVAVVLSRKDLDDLIEAMEPGPALSDNQSSLLDDLKRLRKSAFGWKTVAAEDTDRSTATAGSGHFSV